MALINKAGRGPVPTSDKIVMGWVETARKLLAKTAQRRISRQEAALAGQLVSEESLNVLASALAVLKDHLPACEGAKVPEPPPEAEVSGPGKIVIKPEREPVPPPALPKPTQYSRYSAAEEAPGAEPDV